MHLRWRILITLVVTVFAVDVAVADFLPSGSGAFVAMQLALCRIPVRCDDNYQLLGAGQRPW